MQKRLSTSSGSATWASSPTPTGSPSRRRSRARRQAGELPDTLLLLEHPPVYTRGRRSGAEELPLRRGLLPRQRHRRASPPTAAGGSPTTAPASSSAIRSWRSTTSARYLRTMEDAIVAALAEVGLARALAPRGGHRLHRRVGRRTARSPRSACTSRAASPRTASPSTSTTTSSRSPGSSPAACPT